MLQFSAELSCKITITFANENIELFLCAGEFLDTWRYVGWKACFAQCAFYHKNQVSFCRATLCYA